MIAGTGNGKVILLGEHAAVYGVHAIVAALDLGVRVEVRPGSGPGVTLRVETAHGAGLAAVYEAGDGTLPGQALAALLAALPAAPGAVELAVHSDLPAGVGLGGSAALSVALARGLTHAGGLGAEPRSIAELAMVAESVFHGRPSGVDVAAAAQSGVLAYRRGEPPEPLSLAGPLTLVVAVIEPAPPTHAMIAHVARFAEAQPGVWAEWLGAVAGLVERARRCLAEADWDGLGNALDANHDRLGQLGIGTPALDRACQAARRAGAAGAKLTGAGGGGAVVALAPSGAEAVRTALLEAGASFTHIVRHGRSAP